MSLQSVRGTHDLLPDEFAKHLAVIDIARKASTLAGFKEIATPIFEFTEVYSRTLGDQTDVVTKEMYTFQDKGGDSLTLRPEATAGIARAFISEGLSHQTPLKLFSHGPMFRYERPQKGRQRQFHQLDVELLGVASPLADIECIGLADQILQNLGIRKSAQLEINSIGDVESRKRYTTQLLAFLEKHRSALSPDSQNRLTTNPLRILDSKSEQDIKILQNAPSVLDSLTDDARGFLNQVEAGLKTLRIEYVLNPKLVRGLDYYSHVVFEYRTQELGAQDAILSGGRYDSLIETMGGPATPGVGWGAGIERLVLLRKELPAAVRPIVLVALGEAAERESLLLAQELRSQGLLTELTFSGNMSKRMKKAAGLNARFAIVLGDQELASRIYSVKDFDSGVQNQIPRDKIAAHLKQIY